jgi:amino acid adenylation domain-containing protein
MEPTQIVLGPDRLIDERVSLFLLEFKEKYSSVIADRSESEKQRFFLHCFEKAFTELDEQTKNNLKNIFSHLLGQQEHFAGFLEYITARTSVEFDIQVRQGEETQGFDQAFGTVTAPIIGQFGLGESISYERWAKSVRYVPSPLKIVLYALDKLADYCHRYQDYTFIDIGSGMGRNLLLASDYPFAKIIGVEISSYLNQLAQSNIDVYQSDKQECFDISLVEMDALDFQFPKTSMVLYFYWPFPEEVSDQFIKNLEMVIANEDAHVVLIFLNGLFPAVERSPYFAQEESKETTDMTGANTLVYTVDIYSNRKALEHKQSNHHAFWKQKLEAGQCIRALSHTERQEKNFGVFEQTFGDSLSEQLQKTAKSSAFNTFKLLLAAFSILKQQYDVAAKGVVSPKIRVSDKTDPKGLVFLTASYSDRDSARSLLKRMHQELEIVLAYQDYHYRTFIRQYLKKTALKDHAFSFGFGYGGVNHFDPELEKADLLLWIDKRDAGYVLKLRYDQLQNEPGIGPLMAKHFFAVLGQLCKDLDRSVDSYEIGSSAERKRLKEVVKGLSDAQHILPIEDIVTYPLSPQQRRIFILQYFDKSATQYNMPFVYPFAPTATYTPEEILAGFEKIVQRHDILRTAFSFSDDMPVQKICKRLRFNIETYRDADENEVLDQFIRPFDLSEVPLFRIGYLENKGHRYLLFDIHHIISDGLSQQIILQELRSILDGEDLPTVKLQYKDYVQWLLSGKQVERIKKQEAYWLGLYAELPPSLELPTDFPRPQVQQFKGTGVSFSLSQDEIRLVRTICKEQGTTVYIFLLTVWNILLAKVCGQEDIVVGTPVAGRTHPDLRNMIGMFVNTLPLRNRPEGEKEFIRFLAEVKQNFIHAIDNQDYPFDQLVEKVWDARIKDRSPLFDTMFDLVDQNLMNGFYGQVSREVHFTGEEGETKFDLSLTAMDYGDEIGFECSFSTSLFSEQRMRKFIGSFRQLIRSIGADPTQKISEISLLSKAEEQDLLQHFQGRALPLPQHEDIISRFKRQVEKWPDRIAVQAADALYTYKDIDQLSDQMAGFLDRQLAGGTDQLVGVKLDRTEWLIVSIFGVLKSGNAYLPLAPTDPVKRHDFILADSRCRLLIDEEMILRFRAVQEEFISFAPLADIDADQLAYVIYTSGSTGNPKGCMIAHRNVIHLYYAQRDAFGIKEDEHILLLSSIAFDASVEQIYLALLSGAKLSLVEAPILSDPGLVSAYIEEQEVTHIHLAPSLLSAQQPRAYPSLRRIAVGGEKCPVSLATAWGQYHEFYNQYGPTETTVTAIEWKFSPAEILSNALPIGKPLANVRIYILDQHLKLLPVGAKGELFIGGAGLGKGYWDRPDLNASKFIDSPFNANAKLYRTGDWGYWLPNGNIGFLGRKDEQIKLRGYRIELGEIENTLLNFEQVNQAAVVLHRGEGGNGQLVAFIQADTTVESEHIRTALSTILPDYMIPSRVIQLPVFPMTSSGKIDKRALSEQVPTQIQALQENVPAGNPTEKKLVDIWQELLLLDDISIRDNFFDLGGHSILSMRLIAAINEHFDLSLGIKKIIEHPTIESLAEVIRTGTTEKGLLTPMNAHLPDQPCCIAIPPILGTSTLFLGLAKLLEEQQISFYGLQYRGFDYETTFDASIEQMALGFFKEIEKEIPNTAASLTILGYSMGASIGFELMKLVEEKYPDSRLILLDRAVNNRRGLLGKLSKKQSWEKRLELLESLHLGRGETRFAPDKLDRIRRLLVHNSKILLEHKTRGKIQKPILAIEAELEAYKCKMRSWQNYTTATFAHHYLICDHFSFLNKAFLPQTAALINDFINESDK